MITAIITMLMLVPMILYISGELEGPKGLNRDKKISIIIAVILLIAGFVTVINGVYKGYSNGYRVGSIIKFSEKGIAVRSWEGEMVLGGVKSGMVANTWKFTVIDTNVIKQIKEAHRSDSRITLKYIEWLQSPLSMVSDYEIIEIIEIIETVKKRENK